MRQLNNEATKDCRLLYCGIAVQRDIGNRRRLEPVLARGLGRNGVVLAAAAGEGLVGGEGFELGLGEVEPGVFVGIGAGTKGATLLPERLHGLGWFSLACLGLGEETVGGTGIAHIGQGRWVGVQDSDRGF